MEQSRYREWMEFAIACKCFWDRCDFQGRLVAACGGNEDIAWAVYFHHAANSLEWVDGKVPALGRYCARDLIRRGRGDKVRECLWRTP